MTITNRQPSAWVGGCVGGCGGPCECMGGRGCRSVPPVATDIVGVCVSAATGAVIGGAPGALVGAIGGMATSLVAPMFRSVPVTQQPWKIPGTATPNLTPAGSRAADPRFAAVDVADPVAALPEPPLRTEARWFNTPVTWQPPPSRFVAPSRFGTRWSPDDKARAEYNRGEHDGGVYCEWLRKGEIRITLADGGVFGISGMPYIRDRSDEIVAHAMMGETPIYDYRVVFGTWPYTSWRPSGETFSADYVRGFYAGKSACERKYAPIPILPPAPAPRMGASYRAAMPGASSLFNRTRPPTPVPTPQADPRLAAVDVADPIAALPEPLRTEARWRIDHCCRAPLPPVPGPGSSTPIGCASEQVLLLAARVRAAGYPAAADVLKRCADRRRLLTESPPDDYRNGFALGGLDCKYRFRRVVGGTSVLFQEGYKLGYLSGGCK